MLQSGILEKMTQSLDELYRLVEEQAHSNYFIHEVSINKKNLLKTMRELYTEHNNQLRTNKSLEETVDSLKQQLNEREQNLKQLPTETVIKQHFSDLETRAAALEEKLEEKYKNQSPILASLHEQMKQMDEELKNVKGSLGELSDSESSNEVQIEQINTATKNLQLWTQSLDEKIQSLLHDQSEEAKRVEELFQKVTDSDREVKEALEKVHNYLDDQPDMKKQMDQLEKRLDEMKQNIEDVEQLDMSAFTERLDQLEESIEQDKGIQLHEKIEALTDRLEELNQKVDHIETKPNKVEKDVSHLNHQLSETDKKVAFILEFLEKYTEYQNELPGELQHSIDELIEKMQRLEDSVQSTQEDVKQIKEKREKPTPLPEEIHDPKEEEATDFPLSNKNEKFVEEKTQPMRVDQDSWFYHSLRNLSETQGSGSFQPPINSVRKRRKKKKTDKHTDSNKGKKEQPQSAQEYQEENLPVNNDQEPKQTFAPNTPQQTDEKDSNKIPDVPKITSSSQENDPIDNDPPSDLGPEEFSSLEEKQIPDIQEIKELDKEQPEVEKYETVKESGENNELDPKLDEVKELKAKESEIATAQKVITKEGSSVQKENNSKSFLEGSEEESESQYNKKTLMERFMNIFSMT